MTPKKREPHKLLVLSHSGVVDVNRAIYQQLARVAEVDLTLIVPTQWAGNLISDLSFKKTGDDKGIRVLALPIVGSGRGSLFLYRTLLWRQLGKWQPDTVFVDEEPWSLNAFFAFASFRKVRRVFFTKENLKRKYPPPFWLFEKFVFWQSDHAYSVAEEVTRILHDYKGYDKPIHSLPHSIDPKFFFPHTLKKKEEFKQKLGIPKEACVFSYFGRLTEEKGIRDLLTAIEKTNKDPAFSNAWYLLVGSGPLSAEVRARLPKTSTLLEAIPHHDVASTMALSDVLILPSRTTPKWKEQFGRVLIEAMACGASVIGSDSGEIPHLIQRTGGGLIFPEGNAEELFKQMRLLASDSEKLRGYRETGFHCVLKDLTHEAVA